LAKFSFHEKIRIVERLLPLVIVFAIRRTNLKERSGLYMKELSQRLCLGFAYGPLATDDVGHPPATSENRD